MTAAALIIQILFEKCLIYLIFSPGISCHPCTRSVAPKDDMPSRFRTTDVDNSVLVFNVQTVSDLNAKRAVPSVYRI